MVCSSRDLTCHLLCPLFHCKRGGRSFADCHEGVLWAMFQASTLHPWFRWNKCMAPWCLCYTAWVRHFLGVIQHHILSSLSHICLTCRELAWCAATPSLKGLLLFLGHNNSLLQSNKVAPQKSIITSFRKASPNHSQWKPSFSSKGWVDPWTSS